MSAGAETAQIERLCLPALAMARSNKQETNFAPSPPVVIAPPGRRGVLPEDRLVK
jgi:hypothetical protein